MVPAGITNTEELRKLYLDLSDLLSRTPRIILQARKCGPGWVEKASNIDKLVQAMRMDVNDVLRKYP